MLYEDKDLTFKVPDDWIVEDEDGVRSIFNEDGEGAITMSFYRIIKLEESIEKHIENMALKYVEDIDIKTEKNIELVTSSKEKSTVCMQGKTFDGWFLKLWVVAKFPTAIVITYWSEEETEEINTVDEIVESFKFKKE